MAPCVARCGRARRGWLPLRVERMACIIGGGIGDCFLHLGWIATWSEPRPALVIGAIEEEPFAIWPVAQLLGWAHA
jgi:hypothetical protein